MLPDDSLLASPTAFSPAATPNNFPAIAAIPFPVNPTIAFVNDTTPGATALTILNPLYATYSFGNNVIAFAISLSCSFRNPANVVNAPVAVPMLSEKFSTLFLFPKAPVSCCTSMEI